MIEYLVVDFVLSMRIHICTFNWLRWHSELIQIKGNTKRKKTNETRREKCNKNREKKVRRKDYGNCKFPLKKSNICFTTNFYLHFCFIIWIKVQRTISVIFISFCDARCVHNTAQHYIHTYTVLVQIFS